jgi:dolichol-phosphate mannosyltransferase
VRLSIVVPCYNEEDGIDEFHRRTRSVLNKLGLPAEIVFVNDGSCDRTLQKLLGLQKRDNTIVIVDLARNYGHQLALSAGLAAARGDRILSIDADLQDPPETLAAMLTEMDEGADVVFAKRSSRAGESNFKLGTATAFYWLLSRLSGVMIPTDTGDFRLMSRRVVDALNQMPEPHRFLRGMVAWVGFQQATIEYHRAPRYAGSTHYSLGKMFTLALDAVTGFAVAPLRFVLYLSVFAGAVSLVILLWVLYTYITAHSIQGWTSVIGVVLLFSSIQLFTLGIMAEYIGRIFMQGKRRPLYMVKSVKRIQTQRPTESLLSRDSQVGGRDSGSDT